jgi:trimethylamine:corrinoid methyltransferase-like protein
MKKLEVVDKEKRSQIHDASLKILAETGVVFHHEEALSVFKKHGAKVEGQVVKFPVGSKYYFHYNSALFSRYWPEKG